MNEIKVKKASWLKKMMDKVKNTPEFKDETIKLLEGEIEWLISRIKELESQLKPCDDAGVRAIEERWEFRQDKVIYQCAIEDINYLLSYIRRCQTEKLQFEAELNKWKVSHKDIELQEMKEQSQQSSLSAKQAYINALEWKVKHSERKMEELELRIAVLEPPAQNYNKTLYRTEQSEAWVKELEGGIEKHNRETWKLVNKINHPIIDADIELWKLVEKE